MKLRPSTLARLQELAMNELECVPNTGKYSFFTWQQSQNTEQRDLVKCELATSETLDKALSSINYFNNDKPLVGIDIESTRLEHYLDDSEIIGIGFTIPQYEFKQQPQTFRYLFIQGDDIGLIKILEKFNPYVRWCLHNAKFDVLWILNHLGVMLQHVEDTMVMYYLLTCGTGKPMGIDKLAQEFLNRYPYTLEEMTGKSKKHLTPDVLKSIPLQQLGDYCCEDTYESWLLYHKFKNMLMQPENIKLWYLYDEIEKHCIHHLVWMEHGGIRVDLDTLAAIREDVLIEQEVILDEASLYAPNVNMDSPLELSKFLYEELKLPTKGIKKGKMGFYSTDKESLSKNGWHPLPNLLLEYRKLGKLNSSFLKPLPSLQRCNRIHATFNNCMTYTGRYSCTNPNLQTIPNASKSTLGKRIRQLYTGSPDFCIIRCDYSQMELRILTEMSQDKYLIDCYTKGLDMHVLVTELIFDIKYDPQNPDHKKLRTLCKTLNFGLIYGMTGLRLYGECLKIGLERTLDWCQVMLDNYWEIFTGVRDWMFGTAYIGTIERGYTETLHGRRRYFEFKHPYLRSLRGTGMDYTYENYKVLEKKGVLSDPYDMECLRAAGNAPIQGSNADAIRIAANRIYDEFGNYNLNYNSNYNLNYNLQLLLLVHDEVVAECPWDVSSYCRDRIVDIMESAYPMSVPTKVSASISDSWGNAD